MALITEHPLHEASPILPLAEPKQKSGTVLRCISCFGKCTRVRRTLFERWKYAKAYQCNDCGQRLCLRGDAGDQHRGDRRSASACPSCHGSKQVTRSRGVDKIDALASFPPPFLWKLLGATLFHCHRCRLQYYRLV